MTPSLWPRPYSSPVSTTPCWRGSPPPGTKPDSGSCKANIYNLDIFNNFVQMLYVSLWWSALRVCNLCIPPGRDFLSHQGYLNAVSKSTIPVRVIILWIVTNLQWYICIHSYLTWLPVHTEMELVVSHEQIHLSLTASAVRFPALQVSLQVHHIGVPQIPDKVHNTGVRQTPDSEHTDTCNK